MNKFIVLISIIVVVGIFFLGFHLGNKYDPYMNNGDFLGTLDVDSYEEVYSVRGRSPRNPQITEQLAAEIGNVVLKHTYGEVGLTDTKFAIYEEKGNDAYVVIRYSIYDDFLNGVGIAIDKEDGSILRIWREI